MLAVTLASHHPTSPARVNGKLLLPPPLPLAGAALDLATI